MFFSHFASGDQVEALRLLAEGIYPWPMWEAMVYAFLGNNDEVFASLEAASPANLTPFLKGNAHFDPLRDDPRFQDLRLRMNLGHDLTPVDVR